MNATEQRQRHTALAEVEEHLHDVMTVLEAMAAQIVKDRDQTQGRAIVAEKHILELNQKLHDFTAMTVWQRLRWLVGL